MKNRQRVAAVLCACLLVSGTCNTAYAGNTQDSVWATETEAVSETETPKIAAETTETEVEASESETTETEVETLESEMTETEAEAAETEVKTPETAETEVETPESETEAETEIEAETDTVEDAEQVWIEEEDTLQDSKTQSVAQDVQAELEEEILEENDDPLYQKMLQNEQNDASANTTAYGTSSLTHNAKFADYQKIYGIDVSKYQESIDWSKVKSDGIDFAMIRLGYRGYGTGTLVTDEYFAQNMKGAKNAGVQIGIYFFTQAISVKEAEAEADYVIEKLSGYSGYVSWPVIIDMESLSGSRLDNANLSYDTKTAICEAFCKKIEKAGYTAGVYSNEWYLSTQFDTEKLASSYYVWMANYTNKTSYSGTYNMWQYTSSGSVSGISGKVDMNVAYVQQTPAKPQNLSQTAADTDSISLKWGAVANADSYRVYCYDAQGNTVKSVKVKDTSITLDGLDAGTTYSCKVRAYWTKSDGTVVSGNKSAAYNVYTTPGKVKNLKVSAQGTNSITLSWSKLKGATGYRIYQYDESTGKYVKIGDKNATTMEITGLASGKNYRFKVRAYNKLNGTTNNCGAYTDVLSAYTKTEKVANLQSTDVTEDTVSLKWKKQSGVSGYQVTCFDAKGNKLKSYSTTKGSYTVESLSPKTEYQFKVRSYVLQDDGTKLYGAYSAQLAVTTLTNKYTIQFNGNGSTSGSTAAMKNRTTGKTYTLTANGFKRKGYTFTGWNTKADGSGKSYADKASVKTLTTGGKTKTLYAQWKKTKYTITYELNGGVNNESNPATYTITTKSFALKNPTKKGYTFVGWYSDDTYKNKVTEITKGSTGKKTLYAKWKANKYTIQFDGNGSTGGKMESMTDCKYATSYELNANKFKRTGYEFVGWNTKADGTGTSYSDGEAVKKLSSKSGGTVTLYAQWQEIQETEEPQE